MKQTLTIILTIVVTIAIMSLFGGGVGQPVRQDFGPHIVGFQVEAVEGTLNGGSGGGNPFHIAYRIWSDGQVDYAVVKGANTVGSSVFLNQWDFQQQLPIVSGWNLLPATN